jgi:hypothetical protein
VPPLWFAGLFLPARYMIRTAHGGTAGEYILIINVAEQGENGKEKERSGMKMSLLPKKFPWRRDRGEFPVCVFLLDAHRRTD